MKKILKSAMILATINVLRLSETNVNSIRRWTILHLGVV